MLEPFTWIENGGIEITDGFVSCIGKARSGVKYVDHGSGVILPALVNAHTHVGLSGLADLVNSGPGFTEWVKALIRLRMEISEDATRTASLEAARSIKDSGTGYIAEVGTIEPVNQSLDEVGIEGTIFMEVLGNIHGVQELPKNSKERIFSYAGHALHTTAPTTLRALKQAAVNRNGIFSLHLAESEAESRFLAGDKGEWSELLDSKGIDYQDWDLGKETPVQRANRLGLLDPDTLAVHLLQITPEDIALLADSGASVCVCPRSNRILHDRLPDLPALLNAGLTPALGTDSLASNFSLNLFDEAAFTAENYPDIRPETILAMASCFGADALGCSEWGRIQVGVKSRLIYVDLEAGSAPNAASELVINKHEQVNWL